MDGHEDAGYPRWAIRLAWITLAGALIFVGVLLVLALAGVSDPRPKSAPRVSDPLTSLAGWSAQPLEALALEAGAGLRLEAAGPDERALAAAPYQIAVPGVLAAQMRQAAGPPESYYGIWWGESPEDCVVALVNTDGYFGIEHVVGTQRTWVRAPARWPHIRGGDQPNTFQLDVSAGQAVLWINDERAAAIPLEGSGPLRAGFVVVAGPHEGAAVLIEHLWLWDGPPPQR